MKRILALFLCAVLFFSVFGATAGAATQSETARRDQAAEEIKKDIEALGTLSQDSLTELAMINQKLLDFCYLYGQDQEFRIGNVSVYDQAIEQYNALPKTECLFGDVGNDTIITAKDALQVLRASVGKEELTHWQAYIADVNVDGAVNAKDALMMLQFAVNKREGFPVQEIAFKPFERETCLYTVKSARLYQTTYQSMIDRTREDGYAQPSITGAYPGMFCRDSSIQIMAHIEEGDFEQARLILDFITDYHIRNNYYYVIHIIYPETYSSPSSVMQIDTTFFFLHAWYQFATMAPKTAQNKAYIEGSYDKIKEFANTFLNLGELDNDYGLLYNLNFEHTRDTSYWQSYDLLTNVYASQAYYEIAQYFKTLDPENAKRWQEASTTIANGIHNHLTVELDGALMYAELRGNSHKAITSDPEAGERLIAGFSWVNLAPMGCDWYAAKPEIVEHTYQMYLKYGACKYYRKVDMLDACTNFNLSQPRPIRSGNHVIGKGLAWEIMYCKKMGYTQRLGELAGFLEEFCDTMYRETWVYSGGGADTGNQEQASWLLVANKIAFPKLKH